MAEISGFGLCLFRVSLRFFTIYILFVIFSKPFFQILDIFPKIFFVISAVIYVIAFYFRIYQSQFFDHAVLQWLHINLALFGTTFFQFLLGIYSLKYRWKPLISRLFYKLPFKNLVALIGIIFLIVFHAYIPNFIIAPLTGLGFILLFTQIYLPKYIEKGLDFLTPHATNMWLTHMFFYLIFFRDFIYSPNYVIPIFLLLVLCCILTSYIINFILNFKTVDLPKKGTCQK